MSIEQYFSINTGFGEPHPQYPGYVPTVGISGRQFPGCIMAESGWLTAVFDNSGERLTRHKSDELYMFIGSDVENPEMLGAEITLQIENDLLTLTRTCAVFIPAGAAHGRLTVKALDKPVILHMTHMNADAYYSEFADATAPKGAFAGNCVERYARPDGTLPEAPPGFLRLLLFLDNERLSGAPYLEATWFLTENNTGPAPHDHDFDELIGFLGADPQHPGELGATVDFYIGDEHIVVTQPTLIYVPRGVMHSPLLIPELETPIIHFSYGNGGAYARKNDATNANNYTLPTE